MVSGSEHVVKTINLPSIASMMPASRDPLILNIDFGSFDSTFHHTPKITAT